MTTKEQERKALEQIRKIVSNLGEGSYIATALQGCLEIADSNIEYDFADSMQVRWEKAQADADYFQKAASEYSNEAAKLNDELMELRKKVLTKEEHQAIVYALSQRVDALKELIASDAGTIVEMADTPQDIAFQHAVEQHRRHRRELQSMELALDSVIRKI